MKCAWYLHGTIFVVQTVPHRAAIVEIWFDKSSIQQYSCIYTNIRPKCTYTRGNSSCNLFDMFGPWKILKTIQSRRLLQGLIKQHEIEFSWDISTGQYQSSSGLLRYLLRYLCDFCKFVISSSWVYESSVQMHEIHVGWIVLVLFYLSAPLILRGFTHKEGKMLAGPKMLERTLWTLNCNSFECGAVWEQLVIGFGQWIQKRIIINLSFACIILLYDIIAYYIHYF